jgi:hypothetical protein
MRLLKQNFYTITIALFFAFITMQTNAQNLVTPRNVSPAADVKQQIGLTEIVVNYSRPKVNLRGNDRTGKIWGQQVPWGFEQISFATGKGIPWRAGANENTIISFSDDVKIEGKNLSAGTYGLHMAVYEDGKVIVIFSSNHTSWGSFTYDESEDVLRVETRMKDHPKTEALTYDFIDYGADFAVLALMWENKIIPFKVEIDAVELILQSYRNQLRSIPGFGSQAYVTAANYSLRNKTNYEEALSWIDIAISRNSNFNSIQVKANLLAATGKQGESDKMMEDALEIASNNELNNYGYQLLGQKKNEEAIKVFELNAKRNPKDPNVHDSLGEAYKINGENEKAIKSFKKSLSLDPPPNVKANSTNLLKELGVVISE